MAASREPFVRLLSLADRPTSVLRRLRGEPGLVGLVGAWAGGGAIRHRWTRCCSRETAHEPAPRPPRTGCSSCGWSMIKCLSLQGFFRAA